METWKNKHGKGLPPGPWVDEPDKAHWVDETTDLDCLIHRNRVGSLCGYVGVPPAHPAFGMEYDVVDVDVHGGLTYADKCNEMNDAAEGICHVPLSGRSDEVWWLGFDCAHSFDVCPRLEEMHFESAEYRGFDYVKTEVESLARQLVELTR